MARVGAEAGSPRGNRLPLSRRSTPVAGHPRPLSSARARCSGRSNAEFSVGAPLARRHGTRSALAVPLLREGGRHRGDRRYVATQLRAVHRAADRAAGDVRGPGRHRHRERAPVRGAGAAQRPALTERARAADRDRRGAARHRIGADRPGAGAPGDRRDGRPALRGPDVLRCSRSASETAVSRRAPTLASIAERRLELEGDRLRDGPWRADPR